MTSLSVEMLAAGTVGQTIKTWSVMETIISVSGIGFVLLLSLVL